jgi:hypothetical protein
MMVMARGSGAKRSRVLVSCVTAQLSPSGDIIYGDVRLTHDASIRPKAHAKGRGLDPRPDKHPDRHKRGDKPNASWVELMLDLDEDIDDAVLKGEHLLPIAPNLPTFWAGFQNPTLAPPSMTATMLQLLADEKQLSVAAVAAMPRDIQLRMASEVWPSLWRKPHTENNLTGLYLIDVSFLPGPLRRQASKLYEDFSELVGVDSVNPATAVTEIKFPNIAKDTAKELGFDIANMVEIIAEATEYAPEASAVNAPAKFTAAEYTAAVERLDQLCAAMRDKAGDVAKFVTQDELLEAVLAPTTPMVVALKPGMLAALPQKEVVAMLRQLMEEYRPVLSKGTTNADLWAAAQRPDLPLHSSRAPKAQVLHRDTQLALEEALVFSSDQLGREGVRCVLHREYVPPQRRNRVPVLDIATQPVVVQQDAVQA